MTSRALNVAGLLLCWVTVTAPAADDSKMLAPATDATPTPPNFVFILADDLGYSVIAP